MGMDYVREKLYVAVHGLATSAEPLALRLEGAFVGALIRLQTDDFPERLRGDFDELRKLATKAGPSGTEGSFAHTMRTLSMAELEDLAERIWRLFADICDPLDIERHSREPAPTAPRNARKKK
jgi:hypothetical protein